MSDETIEQRVARLEAALEANAARVAELPEWARRAVSTDRVFSPPASGAGAREAEKHTQKDETCSPG